MSTYQVTRKKSFDRDVAKATGRDPVLYQRVQRRIAKLEENPLHHGYHAGGRIRCNWIAGIGNWAIVYEVDDAAGRVALLRFVSLDDV